MRTYSLTVPLEERTLTVLGYMRTSITTHLAAFKGNHCELSVNSCRDCHYDFWDSSSGVVRKTSKTRGFREWGRREEVDSPQTWVRMGREVRTSPKTSVIDRSKD